MKLNKAVKYICLPQKYLYEKLKRFTKSKQMKKINFTIKLKLILYAASIVLTMGLLGLIFKNTLNKMTTNKSISDEFKSVWIKTLEIRKSEKDFLLRENTNMKFFETGESKYAAEI